MSHTEAISSFLYNPPAVPVIFGAGSASTIGHKLTRIGAKTAAVLCSPTRVDQVERVAHSSTEITFSIFPVMPDVDSETFDRMQMQARSQFGGLVAFGGGEIIRIGKAFAANTRLPMVAVPTTYSGAEFAANWYIGSGSAEKRGADAAALPSAVIYDCELTVGLPSSVAAASGMNAMAHAVESLYGLDRNPLIEAAAEEAVRRLNDALPRIIAHPDDLQAQNDTMLAAWLAGAYRARTSLEHTLAQYIRHSFGLNHAATHAVVLPYVVAYNVNHTPEARERLQRALGAEQPAVALHQLNRRLGLKTGLRDIGMSEAQVTRTIDDLRKQKLQNPREVSAADLESVIWQAYSGDPPASV